MTTEPGRLLLLSEGVAYKLHKAALAVLGTWFDDPVRHLHAQSERASYMIYDRLVQVDSVCVQPPA